MALLAFALTYGGFLALCLSMDRHHQDVMGGRRPGARRRYRLRGAGWALLALSAWPCIAAWGWTIGPVGWCGVLTAAALPLVFLLPYAPRVAIWLGPALPAVAAVAFLIS
jgi:hypothetical protein